MYDRRCKELHIVPRAKVYRRILKGVKDLRKRQKKLSLRILNQDRKAECSIHVLQQQEEPTVPSVQLIFDESIDNSATQTRRKVSTIIEEMYQQSSRVAVLKLNSLNLKDEDLIAIFDALQSKV